MIFGKGSRKDPRVSLEQINEAAKTFILAAKQNNSQGIQYNAQAVSNKGEREDWIVKAEKQGGHDLWLVWSNEHRGWWSPGRVGYVQSRKAAGRYTYDDALEIVRSANAHRGDDDFPFETMVKDEHKI